MDFLLECTSDRLNPAKLFPVDGFSRAQDSKDKDAHHYHDRSRTWRGK